MILAFFCTVNNKVWMNVNSETGKLELPYFIEDDSDDEMMEMLRADGKCSKVEVFDIDKDTKIYVANHSGLIDRENETFVFTMEDAGHELVTMKKKMPDLDAQSLRWLKEIEERGLFAKLALPRKWAHYYL